MTYRDNVEVRVVDVVRFHSDGTGVVVRRYGYSDVCARAQAYPPQVSNTSYEH
jgi:hypothetical protein